MANAHPYEVLNKAEHGIDLWMVHNGILSGVSADQKHMSDTWHFIRDTMRPMLASFPELLRNPAFIELVEDRIGASNKLVFMDSFGTITTINEAAFHNFSGAKLSNTYAWSSWSKDNLKGPVEHVKTYKHSWSKSSLSTTTKYNSYSSQYGSFYDAGADKEADPETWDETQDFADMEELVYSHTETVTCLLQDYGVTSKDLKDYIGAAA